MNTDKILRDISAGKVEPVYLVSGDLVVAEPQAVKVAEALAKEVGCEVERHRRPTSVSEILADLKTFSLFATAKVVLVSDSALLADQKGAAELIDQAAEALPLRDGELAAKDREAASRLLQALRIFGVDPLAGSPGEALSALPKWAFEGGLRRSRKRAAKDAKKLREGLEGLLSAARDAGLEGFAEGDLAELGAIVRGGLPDGHALVLAEAQVAAEHPIRKSLAEKGALVELGQVAAGKKGGWEGLAPLAEELAQETGVRIARDALAELAHRTLKQKGDWKNRSVDAESTSRFAAEYRKLAGLLRGRGQTQGASIDRKLVEEQVEDRGEQDVWQILDDIGAGRGGQAVTAYHRYLAGSDSADAARLSFFSLLARFCRQLTAVAGIARAVGVPRGEGTYFRFKDKWAPRLQQNPLSLQGAPHRPPGGSEGGTIQVKNPLAGIHPFQLHRAYLAASSMPAEALLQLPVWLLETELRIKGDSKDADAAVVDLMARLVRLTR